MLGLIPAIIFGIAMVLLMLMAFKIYRGAEFVKRNEHGTFAGFSPFGGLGEKDVVISFCAGGAVCALDFLSQLLGPSVVWLAWIFVIALMAMTVAVMAWSYTSWGIPDSICFIAIYVLLFLVTNSVMQVAITSVTSTKVSPFLLNLPMALLVVAIVFEIVTLCYYRFQRTEGGMRTLYGALMAVASAICVIVLITALIVPAAQAVAGTNAGAVQVQAASGNTSSSKDKSVSKKNKQSKQQEIEDGSWLYYYNLYLQADGIEGNEYNFGSNPYEEGKTAADYDAELRFRMQWDSALYAADSAWLDANVGTRYLGEFYESCKGDWAKTMNKAKEAFAKDQMVYYRSMDAFFAFLDSAVSITVERSEGLTDQMYMNPYTADGVPDVIVFETSDHEGWFLVYTFVIKETETVKVAYRIDCGFQPTNVKDVMHITPQPKPQPEPNPTPGPQPQPQPEPTVTPTPPTPTPTPSPSPTPTPPTPTPSPTPTPTPTPPTPTPTPPTPTPTPTPTPPTPTPTPPTPEYHKDPEDGTQNEDTEDGDGVNPNNNPGPGEDTNNGEGATESTADQPSNSNHYPSYEEYREEMEEMADTNAQQRTGGDSNTPSYTPSTQPDAADNNGNAINPPTSTQPTETTGGQELPNNPSNAAQEWGGDSDDWQPK